MRKKKTKALAQPRTVLPEATKVLLQGLADEGAELLRKTVESVVATGQFFIRVKDSLPPGQFGLMFKDDIKLIDRPMKITQHMAEQYMCVARSPILADSTHWVELPSSYRTLHQLSLLPKEMLERFIKSGVVFPELTRNGAEALVYGHKRWKNFTTEYAREVVTCRKRLDRREMEAAYRCQCQCGHTHTDQRLKARPRPPDLSQKQEGKGDATT